MKKAVYGIIALIVIVFLVTSGLFEGLTKFYIWLVSKNMTQSSVSIAGEIFVKVATFAISYSLVGVIFNALGWFNKDIMKAVYFVVSTLISFALCYLVMVFETHLLIFAIVFGCLLLAILAFIIIMIIRNVKRNKATAEVAPDNGEGNQ